VGNPVTHIKLGRIDIAFPQEYLVTWQTTYLPLLHLKKRYSNHSCGD